MNATFERQSAVTGTGRSGTDVPQRRVGAGLGKSAWTCNTRKLPRRNCRGISIFGVILGVAVAAIVALGLVTAYQSVATNVRTQAVLTTLTTMEATIRRNFANLPRYFSTMDAGLVGAVPSSAVQGTGTTRFIVTPWGGSIYANGGDNVGALHNGSGSNHDNRFHIVVRDLPEAACETIAAAYLNRSDVEDIYVKATTAVFVAGDAVSDNPVTAAGEIQTRCDGGNTNDDQVTIVFRG